MQFKTSLLADLAPASWFTQPEQSSLWVTAYRVQRVPVAAVALKPRILDLDGVRVLFGFGSLKYWDAAQAKIEMVDEAQYQVVGTPEMRKTPTGVYALLLTPFDVDGVKGNEVLTRQRISESAAFLAAFHGRNIIYEHLFDNIIGMGKNTTTTFSRTSEDPMWFERPDLADQRLAVMRLAWKTMASLPDPDRQRIRLSLRWFVAAMQDEEVDSFLKYWIALEILAMGGTTDVRRLNESLARAYQIPYNEAAQRFAVGRLFGLRSQIVHEGRLTPIHGNLLKYLEALYIDLLFAQIKLPNERRAFGLAGDSSLDFQSMLRVALGRPTG